MSLRNQRGQTMVEALVAVGIGLIVIYGAVTFMVSLNNMNARLRLQRLTKSTVQSYAENIRFDPSLFQVTFDNSGKAERDLLVKDRLPLGITNSGLVVNREECKNTSCRAYMGYLIIPHEIIRNFYEVQFTVMNPSNESAQWEASYFITVR